PPVLCSSRPFDSVFKVAGIVAEALHDGPAEEPCDILDYWRESDLEPSPTDLRGCVKGWDRRLPAVGKSVKFLRAQKRLFDAILAELLKSEEISGGQIADLTAQLLHKPKPANHKKKKASVRI